MKTIPEKLTGRKRSAKPNKHLECEILGDSVSGSQTHLCRQEKNWRGDSKKGLYKEYVVFILLHLFLLSPTPVPTLYCEYPAWTYLPI